MIGCIERISAQAHLNAAGLAEIAGFVLASLATEENARANRKNGQFFSTFSGSLTPPL